MLTALAAVLILAGALIWFRPFLTNVTPQPTADVPTPSARLAVSEFAVPVHQEACMQSVTVEPESSIAEFQLRPQKPTPAGGPPVQLVITAPGFRATVNVPGGYPGGGVTLPLSRTPSHSLIAQACFVNRGRSTVLLDGTTEPRTVARSPTLIDGHTVVGDISLTFLSNRPSSLLGELGRVFTHASNLTDQLVPVWLIWILCVLIAFGVPLSVLAAFYLALSRDEASARS
jgi:hypothetical protein